MPHVHAFVLSFVRMCYRPFLCSFVPLVPQDCTGLPSCQLCYLCSLRKPGPPLRSRFVTEHAICCEHTDITACNTRDPVEALEVNGDGPSCIHSTRLPRDTSRTTVWDLSLFFYPPPNTQRPRILIELIEIYRLVGSDRRTEVGTLPPPKAISWFALS